MTIDTAGVILKNRTEKSPETTPFWQGFRDRSGSLNKRILLAEGTDARVISAAAYMVHKKILRPVLVGAPGAIAAAAKAAGIDAAGIEIWDFMADGRREAYAEKLLEKRRAKGMTPEESRRLMEDALYFSAFALADGRADGLVAGAARTTADTVRAAFVANGLAPGADTVFGAFFMECPQAAGGPRRLLFADAAVSPHPSPRMLAAIGIAAAALWERRTGEKARVAFLSFSTAGSAEDDSVSAVRQAAALAAKKKPDLLVGGEFQADAALVPSIAARKGAQGPAAGQANVLIFPDLNAGNIGYKLVQHLGGARAVGPLLQGLAKPMADLSRGCNDEDIVDTAALTCLWD